jgi:hypothetical protein
MVEPNFRSGNCPWGAMLHVEEEEEEEEEMVMVKYVEQSDHAPFQNSVATFAWKD